MGERRQRVFRAGDGCVDRCVVAGAVLLEGRGIRRRWSTMTPMRKTLFPLGLMLSAVVVLAADNHTVNFDNHTDFSTLKTFAMRDGKVDTSAIELNNSLVLKNVTEAIRRELVAK